MMIDETSPEVHSVVTVSPSPWSAIRWGGIVAGVFTVLALLGLLGEIGMALGLSSYSAGDRAAPYLIGAGIWGILCVALAFLGGGYVASAVSPHVHKRGGAAQGLIVWAVAGPVIGLLAAIFAIGTVTAAGVTTVAAVQADPAAAAEAREVARNAAATEARDGGRGTAAARPEFDRNAPAAATVDSAVKRAGAAGWVAVFAMLLGLASAFAGGLLGARCATACAVERRDTRVVPTVRTQVFPA